MNKIDKIDRENTFWLQHGRKICRSINWVYRYYRYFDHTVSFDDKRPYYFEQIRKQGFNKETHKERKLVYTTSEYFKTLTPEEKHQIFRTKKKYNERRQNFLRNATFVAKYDVRLILDFDFEEKSIYEFRLKNETVNTTICDF